MALKNIVNRENYDIFFEYTPIHTDSPLFYSIPSFFHLLSLVRIHEFGFGMHAGQLLLPYIHVRVDLVRFEMYSLVE